MRSQHRDQLTQSLFIVDLQMSSIRSQLDEVYASDSEWIKLSREQLLAFSPLQMTLVVSAKSTAAVASGSGKVDPNDSECGDLDFSRKQQDFLLGLV